MDSRSDRKSASAPRDSARPAARRSPSPSAQHATSSRPQPKHGWSRDRFCEYLRAQRERVSLSIEDIARVTKIPERSLRQLEAGQFEELPADVFVRGFLRSYARVVGVNADEVVRRYAMCGLDPAPVASEFAQVAAEQIAALAEKDPSAGEVAVAKVEPAEPEEPEEPAPPVAAAVDVAIADEASGGVSGQVVIDSGVDEVRTASAPVRSHGHGTKKKRRKSGRHGARHASGPTASTSGAPAGTEASLVAAAPAPEVVPVVDAAPDLEPVARPRVARRERAFLPPAWSEEETGRRGPLTLAVIILVIIATLTMSYLLRRPSYSGDGVTRRDTVAGRPGAGAA